MFFPHRRFYHDDVQALGTLRVGTVMLTTIENPWVHNQPFTSCIPGGDYPFDHINIAADGDAEQWRIRLRDTGDRFFINIEVANWAHQIGGCIGLGMGFKQRAGVWQTTDSRDAFELLVREVRSHGPDVTHVLQTRNVF